MKNKLLKIAFFVIITVIGFYNIQKSDSSNGKMKISFNLKEAEACTRLDGMESGGKQAWCWCSGGGSCPAYGIGWVPGTVIYP